MNFYNNKGLIVLGMHRSGTSVLTRVINLLGADLGMNIFPPAKCNPKGFWENQDILLADEKILSTIEYSWDDMRLFPENLNEISELTIVKDQLKNILQTEFGNSQLFVIKEPRMCRLLDIYISIFEDIDFHPHFIHIFRHPIEVALSLEARNNIKCNKSYLSWLHHILEAEKKTRKYPRIFVSFKTFMSDWESTISKLSSAFDIRWPNDTFDIKDSIDNFIENGLIHFSYEKTLSENKLPEIIEKTYNVLKELENNDNELTYRKLDDISNTIKFTFSIFPTSALLEDLNDKYIYYRRLLKNFEQSKNKIAEMKQISYIYTSKINKLKKEFKLLSDSKLLRHLKHVRRLHDMVKEL